MEREAERIRFLVGRDGADGARRWVEATLEVYRNAVRSPASHACRHPYRPLFDASIRDFEVWLAQGGELPAGTESAGSA